MRAVTVTRVHFVELSIYGPDRFYIFHLKKNLQVYRARARRGGTNYMYMHAHVHVHVPVTCSESFTFSLWLYYPLAFTDHQPAVHGTMKQ